MSKYILGFDKESFERRKLYINEICKHLNMEQFTEQEVYEEMPKGINEFMENYHKSVFEDISKKMGVKFEFIEFMSKTYIIFKQLIYDTEHKKMEMLKNINFDFECLKLPKGTPTIFCKDIFIYDGEQWKITKNYEDKLKEICTVYADNDLQKDFHKKLTKLIKVAEDLDISLDDVYNATKETKDKYNNSKYEISGVWIKRNFC